MQHTNNFNLILLGKTGAGKSASGNTILGRDAFKSKKSNKSVTRDIAVESGSLCELEVHVYDTPGLFDTDATNPKIHFDYEELFQRCESLPGVFLLVIKADRFTEEERRAVEKIEQILGEKRLKKTWILFTRGDELEGKKMTIEELIEDTEPLKNLVQKYNQRYHLFNNRKRGDTEQVNTLFQKVHKTNPDTIVLEETVKQTRQIRRKYEQETPVSGLSPRRIVLLGKSGVGKSAAGNTILGQRVFRSVMRMSSVTRVCSEAQATPSSRSVSVVDTPGLDTQMRPEDLMTEIARSVYLSSPGPQAFLIVFSVNMRFTEQDQQIPQQIELMFGQGVLKYSIILFTHGDLLEGQSVEEIIEENEALRRLVDQCRGRFHVFNNKHVNNRDQVDELLKKIDSIVEQNGGGHYSHEMFEEAQRCRREEVEHRKQKEEKQRREEIESVIKETEKKLKDEEKKRKESSTGFQQFFSKHKKHIYTAAVVAGLIIGGAVGGVAIYGAAVAEAAAGASVYGTTAGGAALGAIYGASVGAHIGEVINKFLC